MRQLLFAVLLIAVVIPGTIFFASRASYSAESPVTNSTPSANPISSAVPSESAEDKAESHSNTDADSDGNADSSKPLSADVVTKDVLNRFNEVYKQKKIQADRLQIDLTAAKDDLAACDKLSGNEKTKCISEANNHINVITQRISNLNYDMNTIQKEIKDIGQ